MSQFEIPHRRTLLVALVCGLAPLAGCMTLPLRPVNSDGTYCHRINMRGGIGQPDRRRESYRAKATCTPTVVPTDAVEAEAKRFDVDPTSLTVYVLRNRWNDASMVVPVTVDGATSTATIPDSVVRLRLKPGIHRLSAQWQGRKIDINVDGRAGNLRVVELIGSAWAWGTSFEWKEAYADAVKGRARASKLVADLDLRD